ncbi:hypothetical protein [Mycobacterium sp.]|uniref:hypothetical protein n=1 Tax=Mycobacterium sp. TaxID=1785 RepID=UPI003F95916C
MKHSQKDRAVGLRMPRSRGAVSGLLLVILGGWGALIPFVGPHFNFAYTPDRDWAWTTARGWLEVFPGVTIVVGGLLLIFSGNRAVAMFGGWLAVLGGAWFVVGGQFAPMLRIGTVGDPVATTERKRALLEVTYFSGLGALIVFLGGIALARLAVRLARDVEPLEADEPREPAPVPARPLPANGPYVSAVDESSPETAVTRPRVEHFTPSQEAPPAQSRWRRGFRRQSADASGGPSNAYLR